MKKKSRQIHHIIEEQVRKWERMQAEGQKVGTEIPVITISREPGSGGRMVAERISDYLGADLFHREIIQGMAESSNTSTRLLETLDEKGISVLDDWISTLVNDRHLWPDQYLQHLMKVVGAMARHGRAVIVGRGANFILPPETIFRVRIMAPLDKRVMNVARDFGVSTEEARRRVLRTESDRRAFVRKYFHANIGDPVNYDLIINMANINIAAAAEAVRGGLGM